MNKLIVFMGASGTGKTTLKSKLAQALNAAEVVTYTTRPMRPGEILDVTYHYISKEAFAMMALENKFTEYTSYDTVAGTWFYGTSFKSLTDDGIKVAVLNPAGVRALKEKGIPMTVIYVKCNGRTLQQRLEKRGDNPEEIKRRLESDNIDFINAEKLADFTLVNDNISIDKAVKILKKALGFVTAH